MDQWDILEALALLEVQVTQVVKDTLDHLGIPVVKDTLDRLVTQVV